MNAPLSPQTQFQLPCPACGALQLHKFKYSKNQCDILQCSGCGVGRTRARDFDPNTYYAESYFSGGETDGYADYRGAEPVLRREFAGTVDFIRRLRPSGKLIELGCAYGFFLQEAKRYFDVAGVELAAEAAAFCRAQGLNVVAGLADQPTLAALGNADIFVLLDVIEHLSDPYETLRLCVQHLNPGGMIVITTGDFASPLARMTGAAWRLMTPPQHLWFFTPESIRRMSARLALSVQGIDHPWKLVPMSLLAFQLRRMLGLPAVKIAKGGGIGIPVNLFDAMRLVLRKPA
jgi:2-polyprenyl-3-methyl-5-hydroxy-6-metoxy-1,4-benzoquinol methylase